MIFSAKILIGSLFTPLKSIFTLNKFLAKLTILFNNLSESLPFISIFKFP